MFRLIGKKRFCKWGASPNKNYVSANGKIVFIGKYYVFTYEKFVSSTGENSYTEYISTTVENRVLQAKNYALPLVKNML